MSAPAHRHDWHLLSVKKMGDNGESIMLEEEMQEIERLFGKNVGGRWACKWQCRECELDVRTLSVRTDTLVTPLPSEADVERALRHTVDTVHDL